MTTKQELARTDREAMRIGLIRHMRDENGFTENEAKLLADRFIKCKCAQLVGNGWQYVGSFSHKEEQQLVLEMIKRQQETKV